MKRSSILPKIVLAMLILALSFALFACIGKGKKDPEPTPDPTPEVSILDKIGDIVLFANPILDSAKSIKKDSTISADAGLSVWYKTEKSEETFTLGIKGNVSKTSASDLAIKFKTSKQDWVDLAYVGNKLYLNQPVTAVNSTAWNARSEGAAYPTDSVEFDVSAFNGSVDVVMDVVMDVIADVVAGEGFQGLKLDEIGKMLKEDPTISKLKVDTLISLETPTEGKNGKYVITTKPALFTNIKSLVVGPEIALGLTVGGIMDMIFGEETPELKIEANVANEVVNQLAVGFTSGDKKTQGKLIIDITKLAVGNSKAVTVSAPSSTAKALKVSAEAKVGHKKDMDVNLDVYASANDFANKALAYAEANIRKGSNNYVLKGIANQSELKFNMGDLFTAVGKTTSSTSTDYVAKLHNDAGATTLVAMAKDGITQWSKDYYANKGKSHGTKQTGTVANPEKGLMVNIYEFFGGKAADLGTNVTDKFDASKDTAKYNAPSEKQMMTAVANFKIGKCSISQYLNGITIDTTSDKDNYLNTVKSVLARFAGAQSWILGYNLIKSDLSAVKAWSDLFTLDNWVVLKDGKVDDGAIQTAGKAANGKYTYGIFNWDTENYNGGVVVTKAGDNNDLLDAVNWFTKWDPENSGTPVAFTAENISKYANFNLAKAGRFFGDDIVFSKAQKDAIEALPEFVAYQNACDAYDAAKKAYEKAEKDYNANMNADTYSAMTSKKTAMDNAKTERDNKHEAYETAFRTWIGGEANITTAADKVIKAVIGYDNDGAAAGSNYLQALINGGMYLNLGSVKNEGICGFVEIRPSIESEDLFAKVKVSLGFVENTVVTKAAAATFDANAIDLTARDEDESHKIKFFNDDDELVALATVEEGKVVYYNPAGTAKIDKPADCSAKYVNIGDADEKTGILGELLKIWDGYCTTFIA